MKFKLQCGCTYDPEDQKDGYEDIITLAGECRKIADAAFKEPVDASSVAANKFRRNSTQHHFEIAAHPEWKSGWGKV